MAVGITSILLLYNTCVLKHHSVQPWCQKEDKAKYIVLVCMLHSKKALLIGVSPHLDNVENIKVRNQYLLNKRMKYRMNT